MVVPNKPQEQKNCDNVSHHPPKWLGNGSYNWMCPRCGLVSVVKLGEVVKHLVLMER